MFWKYDAGPDDIILWWHQYDAMSDLMHNWVAQTLDFKSALRVVRMVLNTQCYQYLWLAMWFHVKKSEETLKKSKSPILQCKFGSRAQKWPKNAKKTDHSIAIYSIFLYRYGIFWMPPGESSHPTLERWRHHTHSKSHPIPSQAVQNMCEEKEIGINNSMYLQFTKQYRMAKGLC